jgi:nicotinate-nucleotide pyrophosphorylase
MTAGLPPVVALALAEDLGEAGVDAIALGALTHSAPALDRGLDLT